MTGGERVRRKIEEMRMQHGYTQEKVANSLFVSKSSLRSIERSDAKPSIGTVKKITTYFETVHKDMKQEGDLDDVTKAWTY